MSDPAILEAAARALRETENTLGVWDSDDELRQFATAILTAVTPLIRAAALERAAKVAEGQVRRPAREAVAAAIRALKEHP